MMTKEKALEIARSAGWLARQPAAFQDDVLSRCILRSYGEKETIYRAGDPCVGMFGLVSGVIKIEFEAPGGDYKVGSVKQPVFWTGHGAALMRANYLVGLSTATPVTALFLPVHEFERLVETPGHCRCFATLAVEHFNEALQVIGQLLVGNVEDRVALRLAQLSKGSTAPGPVVLPITQSEIAEMCGLSRPTVQQALSGLEKRGLVRPGYRRIEIPEPDKLTLRNGAEPHSLSESEAQ